MGMLQSTAQCVTHVITSNADFHLSTKLNKISNPQLVPPNVTVSQLMSKPNVFSLALHIWSLSVSKGLAACGVMAGKMIYSHRSKDLRAHSGDAFHLVYLPSRDD